MSIGRSRSLLAEASRCGRRRGVGLVLVAALVLGASAAAAEDLSVAGCDERLPGEIGLSPAVGNLGNEIAIQVTVNAMTDIDAFLINVDVPVGALTYLRTERGSLTGGFSFLDGHYFPETNQVRILGLDPAIVVSTGSVGSLAVVVFEVAGSGVVEIGTSSLGDDLTDYTSCEDVHGTAVEPWTWGRVKASYREASSSTRRADHSSARAESPVSR